MQTKKNKILSVYPKKKKKEILVVEFVDGSIYELSKDIVLSESIYVGGTISSIDFKEILEKHAYHQAQSAGLNLLSYRMRSKKELFSKLINKNIDKMAEVKAEVAKIVAKQHQDFRAMLSDEQLIKFDNFKKKGRVGENKDFIKHGMKRGVKTPFSRGV